MLKKLSILGMLLFLFTGCSLSTNLDSKNSREQEIHIGIVFSDTGLGDESYKDSAFFGLEKARVDLGIFFDYREAPDGNFEKHFIDLVEEGNDLVIGLGFPEQKALEKIAKKYPKQQFLLIDGVSDVKNVVSVTFKEHEGSFLVGMVAAMTSRTNKVGFIGGMDIPVIQHFEKGFTQGAKYINPKIDILTDNANNFGEVKIGAKIADQQIKKGADFIFPAAGFTGFGSLKKAQEKGVYSAGVDSDQYYVAEKSVVTSMMKNIDVAVYSIAKTLKEKGKIDVSSYELGLKEDGVGLAPIRGINLSEEQLLAIDNAKKGIISGIIKVKSN